MASARSSTPNSTSSGSTPAGSALRCRPIRCQTDAERDAARATDVRTRTQEEVDAANAASEQIAKGCAALTGAEQGIDGADVPGQRRNP